MCTNSDGQAAINAYNAYNAFTVELILTRHPKLASIRDLGSLLQNPLDDPHIHFAVDCASIGCPMLREEAFVAERLDTQLDEQPRRPRAAVASNSFP